jgi:hypothetical protein
MTARPAPATGTAGRWAGFLGFWQTVKMSWPRLYLLIELIRDLLLILAINLLLPAYVRSLQFVRSLGNGVAMEGFFQVDHVAVIVSVFDVVSIISIVISAVCTIGKMLRRP